MTYEFLENLSRGEIVRNRLVFFSSNNIFLQYKFSRNHHMLRFKAQSKLG